MWLEGHLGGGGGGGGGILKSEPEVIEAPRDTHFQRQFGGTWCEVQYFLGLPSLHHCKIMWLCAQFAFKKKKKVFVRVHPFGTALL